MSTEEKVKLEVGDKIKRFEVMLTKEIDYIYVINSVTKTLAKSESGSFKRELVYNTIHPKQTKNKIIARVLTKAKETWSTPDYFLIEED